MLLSVTGKYSVSKAAGTRASWLVSSCDSFPRLAWFAPLSQPNLRLRRLGHHEGHGEHEEWIEVL